MIDRLDYDAVGFISGLEVHQQLLTAHKLFCRCPGGLYTDQHDGEVLRHMRPTLSELGEYDGTALMEFKTKKEIIYLLNHLNVCTYEMDDTPPFLVNQEAIDVAIELCLMMNMDIIDEVHIARKQYLDGSIPTGFQRTAIVGMNGWLPFKGRKLTVTHVSVEEDSCREVSDKGHRIVWRTDRLGMPLTETVTGPELRTPDEVRDAILLCGLTARSTRRVRTGIGASRQDVNVSVRGGSRVEIKGVPRAGLRGEARPQRGRPPVQPAEAARRAAPPRPPDAGLDSRRGRATSPTSGPPWTSGFIRRALQSGGKVFAVRGRRRGRPGAAPDAARHHVPRRAGRPHPRHRLPRRRADRLLRARTSRSSRGATRCSTASASAQASARTTTCSSSSGPRTTCARPPRRSGCASSTRRRGAEGDAAGAGRRLHDLRAHPARARPHVPGHRFAADARHGGAGRGHQGPPQAGAMDAHRPLRRVARARGDDGTSSSAAAAPTSWMPSSRRPAWTA